MRNLLTLAVLLVSTSVLNAAEVKNGYRIDSYVQNEKAITTVFNGSLFTMVCSGQIYGETVDGELISKDIKKLIVGGDKVVKITLDSNEVMVEAAASLKCYR